MLLGLSLRVAWSCLLLLSSAACFPVTEGDYRYPYTSSGGSSGGPAPGSDLQSEGSHQPLVFLRYEASAPAVNQFPSGAAGPSQGESGFNRPPSAPAGPAWGPVTTETSGVGSGVAFGPAYSPAYSPAYEAPSPGFVNQAEAAGNTAAAHIPAGPVAYAPETSGYGNPSVPGLPWAEPPAWAQGFDPSRWMPSRAFPDFSVWESAVAAPASQGESETSPLLPSSYIIQSSNGYQRAREVLSHSRYSPEYPEPPVWAPSKSAAAPGSKGGLKI